MNSNAENKNKEVFPTKGIKGAAIGGAVGQKSAAKQYSNLTWDELVLQQAQAGLLNNPAPVSGDSETNWKAIGLYTVIGILVIIAGVVIYKKMKKGKENG